MSQLNLGFFYLLKFAYISMATLTHREPMGREGAVGPTNSYNQRPPAILTRNARILPGQSLKCVRLFCTIWIRHRFV